MMNLLFLFCCFACLICSLTNGKKFKQKKLTRPDPQSTSASSSNWAVLIAGSNGYYNYRHQSDVAHAYQLLTQTGDFPQENVIVMMYDDIAYNTQNPFPGQLFNEPGGHNVYEGIHIDYNGSEVTAQNFLNVIQGKETSVKNGKTLKSGPNDNVFIYYTDHGATGIVGMPVGDPLYADDLMSALNYMYENGMYQQLVFYMEACQSGSMFDNILGSNISIYATTAANPYESSYAYYYNQTLSTYMADEYSIRWMQDTTNLWNLEYEMLLQQYINVKNVVTESHPQKYGDFNFDNETIEDFQAYDDRGHDGINDIIGKQEELAKHNRNNALNMETISTFVPSSLAADSRDVKLFTLQHRFIDAESDRERSYYAHQLYEELKLRDQSDEAFFALAKYITGYAFTDDIYQVMKSYHAPSDFKCLKRAYKTFEQSCFKFDDYSLKYVQTLVNLCDIYDSDDVIESIIDVCGTFDDNQLNSA